MAFNANTMQAGAFNGANAGLSSPFGAASPVFSGGGFGAGSANSFGAGSANSFGMPQNARQSQQIGGDPLAQMGMQSMSGDTQSLFMSIGMMMLGVMSMITSLLAGILNGSISGKAPQSVGGNPLSSPTPTPGGETPVSGNEPSTGATPDPKSAGKGGNVDQWVDEAIAILKAQGVPESKMNRNDIKTIIQRESSGNPNAVNNWDSNAKKGTPSKGLMQTIQPTFDSHKLPGYDQILNPVHNIIAGVRYAISRYGSVSNVPGIVGLRNGSGYKGY